MLIDGKQIADDILQKLQSKVVQLKNKEITPTMAVILVGENSGSESYVRQKQKAGERIGAVLRCTKYDVRSTIKEIQSTIHQYNNDQSIHGIIIQRPLPKHLQDPELLNNVQLDKDVDGFVPGSKFKVPVAMAVEKILQKIFLLLITNNELQTKQSVMRNPQYLNWLFHNHIIIIGRGETAGKPIAEYFIHQRCNVSVIHSKTSEKDKQQLLKNARMIISCVGKHRVVTPETIKQGVILISVGIWRDGEGKLHGDYEEDEVEDIASFYTPTPGGVGPVTVACLMENLISAAWHK